MKKFVVLVLLFAGVASMSVKAGEIERYKSLFTLNFIRYIGWPDKADKGEFVIGVLRNKALAEELRSQTGGKKVGFQNIVIKEFSSVDEITSCHVIYVSDMINFSKQAQNIAAKAGSNALIISESNNAISNGSMINFIVDNNLLKFEVSPKNAQVHGLTVSKALMSMNNAILR